MNIDVVNKWLSAGASVAVIVGVFAAIVGVIVATQTLKETQEAASATLVLQLHNTLYGDRYTNITDEIQNNGSAHTLMKDHGGKFDGLDIGQYTGNFEDIGYLVQENIIDAVMAYDHFSYDVEKAWCNTDVQRVIQDARKADKSITAAADPAGGQFEKLALSYLAKENQTCKDLDNQ
jgi:hypothetical protein